MGLEYTSSLVKYSSLWSCSQRLVPAIDRFKRSRQGLSASKRGPAVFLTPMSPMGDPLYLNRLNASVARVRYVAERKNRASLTSSRPLNVAIPPKLIFKSKPNHKL